MIKTAHDRGRVEALVRFKLAGPMGANPGVMPKGEEQSHGTESVQYPQGHPSDPTSAAHGDMPDWLWDIFTSYDGNVAPGRADGSYGQETIG